MVCLVKCLGAADRKISAKKKRPKTTTAPCQELIAPTSLEIAIEFVAMYFLLLLCRICLRATAQTKFVCTGQNRFPSVFNQRAADWAFCGAGKFTRAHAENLVGCRPAILLASAIWSRESEPKYVCVWK